MIGSPTMACAVWAGYIVLSVALVCVVFVAGRDVATYDDKLAGKALFGAVALFVVLQFAAFGLMWGQ